MNNSILADPNAEIDYGIRGCDVKPREKPKSPIIIPTIEQRLGIDLEAADDGKTHSQKQWIEYFNKMGRPMISAPDIYRAADAPKEVLERLREDLKKEWLVTSTKIIYDDGLSARIIHHYGSTVKGPVEIFVSKMPERSDDEAAKYFLEKGGLAYAQALFDTKDDAKKIVKTLEQISELTPEFGIPDSHTRNHRATWTIKLLDCRGKFMISNGIEFDDNGRSRGVSLR